MSEEVKVKKEGWIHSAVYVSFSTDIPHKSNR